MPLRTSILPRLAEKSTCQAPNILKRCLGPEAMERSLDRRGLPALGLPTPGLRVVAAPPGRTCASEGKTSRWFSLRGMAPLSPLQPFPAAPLGTYANSSSPPPPIGHYRGPGKRSEGGAGGSADLGGELSQEAKQALKIISRFAMQDSARKLLPQQRVSHCLRHQAFGQEGVRCYHIPKRKGARLGGLQTCGSVWACPICSAKITERRRVELRAAVDAWRAEGGVVVLLTYTFSHQLGEDLQRLHAAMMRARSLSMSGAPYHKLKGRCGLAGSVRSVELTYGESGWHPHVHELAFVEAGGDLAALVVGLETLWQRGLSKVGLSASLEHGFDATLAGDEVETYIAKFGHEPLRPLWDCAAEMTKQPAKLGRVKGRTPFQLLADFGSLEGADADVAGRLFGEYAGVMLGKRQLEWSRWDTGEKTDKGRPKTVSFLTHLVGKEELSDEATAELSEDDGVLLALLSYPRWRLICADRRRAELWNLLRAGDPEELARFLADYPEMRTNPPVAVNLRPCLVDPFAEEADQLPAVGAWFDPLGPSLDPDHGQVYARGLRQAVSRGQVVEVFEAEKRRKEALRQELAAVSVALPAWLHRAVQEFRDYPRALDALLTEEEAASLRAWKSTFKVAAKEPAPQDRRGEGQQACPAAPRAADLGEDPSEDPSEDPAKQVSGYRRLATKGVE